MNDKVSVVIPVYNQLKLTIKCLQDLLNTVEADLQIIVVDDCSKEPVSRILPKLFPDITLITNKVNLGFAGSINAGLAESKHEYICLLNNDIQLPNPKWLKLLLNSLSEFDLTAPVGGRMDENWNYLPGEAKKRGEQFKFLPFWCIVLKRAVVEKIGPLPLDFLKGFWEDVYYCYLAEKAGFKLGITEDTGVIHLYHQTFKAEGFDLNKEYNEKRKIFLDLIKKGKVNK